MFGLFNKKKSSSIFNATQLKTDMHSHLLPGIDDGSPDVNTSIELISGLKDAGYNKIITTPHILWDMYKNTPDIIKQKLDLVQKELQIRNIDIEINAAAEYFLDDHVAKLLETRAPLLTIKDNMVLVEFSVMHLSMNMKEILFDLQMAGYQPVLAHPERYAYLYKKYEIFHEFKQNGVMFQLNLLSTTGGYGKMVSEMADYFIKYDFYDLIGTDMHHKGHLQRMQSLYLKNEVQELINSGRISNNKL